jgi:hypothetical protein
VGHSTSPAIINCLGSIYKADAFRRASTEKVKLGLVQADLTHLESSQTREMYCGEIIEVHASEKMAYGYHHFKAVSCAAPIKLATASWPPYMTRAGKSGCHWVDVPAAQETAAWRNIAQQYELGFRKMRHKSKNDFALV